MNLGRWPWILLQRNNNERTRITTAYWPTVRVSAWGAYRQKLQALSIMKIKNDPITKFWIDLHTEISKWINQWEQIIPMRDWNSEASEVNTWMETQGLTNTIFNINRYLDDLITYQQSKYCPIDGIYCSYPLTVNQGGFLSFGRLVGDHRAQCIEINEILLLGLQLHDIISPMI